MARARTADRLFLVASLMSALTSAAHAQAVVQGANVTLDNRDQRPAGAVVDPFARAVVNRLAPPDTSAVRALTADTIRGLTPGVASQTSLNAPRAFGSFGIPYTSTRVQAGASNQSSAATANYLSTTYPYRTIGKLFINGGYCSASLIARSVIVTAAHCIQDFGGGSVSFGGWTFVPGHYGAPGATVAQSEPYGRWAWRRVSWPTSWSTGRDTGSGAARNNDLAVIIPAKNSRGQFIGDLVGWMKYAWNNYSFVASAKTGNLSTAATTTAGYPRADG